MLGIILFKFKKKIRIYKNLYYFNKNNYKYVYFILKLKRLYFGFSILFNRIKIVDDLIYGILY